jgi:hypothetical protein
LGEFVGRDDSTLVRFSPEVYPQGSFALGTATRPLVSDAGYDLDLVIELGSPDLSWTQEEMRDAVALELEDYRRSRGIKTELEFKRRCVRIEYRDGISFHMDIVPARPASAMIQQGIRNRLELNEFADSISSEAHRYAVEITDSNSPEFRKDSSVWPLSNPRGYRRWFDLRRQTRDKRLLMASHEPLPDFGLGSPLQSVVQLLKRHRDVMFAGNPESKPISIIITTLAARYYQGEEDLGAAVTGVVAGLNAFCAQGKDRVLNPTLPQEDFADKWNDPDYASLQLRENFCLWVKQLSIDAARIANPPSAAVEAASEGWRVSIKNGSGVADVSANGFKPGPVKQLNAERPKPWRE